MTPKRRSEFKYLLVEGKMGSLADFFNHYPLDEIITEMIAIDDNVDEDRIRKCYTNPGKWQIRDFHLIGKIFQTDTDIIFILAEKEYEKFSPSKSK